MTRNDLSYAILNDAARMAPGSIPQSAPPSDHAISNRSSHHESARADMTSRDTNMDSPIVFSSPYFCRSYNLNNEIGRSIQRTIKYCKETHSPTFVYFGYKPWILWGHDASLTLAVADGAAMPTGDHFVGIDMADFRTELKSDVIFMSPEQVEEPTEFVLSTSGRCWVGAGWRPLAKASDRGGKIRSTLNNKYLAGIMRDIVCSDNTPRLDGLRCLDLKLLSLLPRTITTTVIPPPPSQRGCFHFISKTEHWTVISILAPVKVSPDDIRDFDVAKDIVLKVFDKHEVSQEKKEEDREDDEREKDEKDENAGGNSA